MTISPHLNIYFQKLEDWEIEELIKQCQLELERRDNAYPEI